MDSSQKKLFIMIGVVVLAIAIAIFAFSKSGMTGPQEKAVGSLEEGINKESGLPLNPPPVDQNAQPTPSPGAPNAAPNDPSMPSGN